MNPTHGWQLLSVSDTWCPSPNIGASLRIEIAVQTRQQKQLRQYFYISTNAVLTLRVQRLAHRTISSRVSNVDSSRLM